MGGFGPHSPDFSKPYEISALLHLQRVVMSPFSRKTLSRAQVPSWEPPWDGEHFRSAELWFLFTSGVARESHQLLSHGREGSFKHWF